MDVDRGAARRRRAGSAPASRWPSRRWPGWCGPSSRPCTATTRSSTTSWSSTASRRSAWCSSTTSPRCPPGRPIMLSAHGSAPEVVAAARARGSYVVDCGVPARHQGPPRGARSGPGKGYRIVYVGHEGHEEAVGTMAVAPDAIHRVESVAEVDALPAVRRAGGAARPDHAVAPRLGRRARRHQARASPSLWTPGRSDLCFATTNRQSALMAMAPPLRRHRRDRLGQLVEHPGAREAGRARPGCPRVFRVNHADELPDDLHRHRRRHRRRVGARGAGRRGHRPPRARATASRRSRVTDEDEYFPPPRNIRELQAAIELARHRDARRLLSPDRAWTTARSRPATCWPRCGPDRRRPALPAPPAGEEPIAERSRFMPPGGGARG